jgi:hypothetical protein
MTLPMLLRGMGFGARVPSRDRLEQPIRAVVAGQLADRLISVKIEHHRRGVRDDVGDLVAHAEFGRAEDAREVARRPQGRMLQAAVARRRGTGGPCARGPLLGVSVWPACSIPVEMKATLFAVEVERLGDAVRAVAALEVAVA